MANTYTLISAVTVGAGGAASIDFTSIPSTYTDLMVKLSTRDSNASANNGDVKVVFNASSTSDYSDKWLYGNGGSAFSLGHSSQTGTSIGLTSMDSAGNTASTFGSLDLYVPNYAVSANKSFSADAAGETNATTAYMGFTAGLRSNVAAINQITFYPTTAFVQYSTAYLYGVSNA